MSPWRIAIVVLVITAAGVLIGAQSRMGTIPPWLFYPALVVFAGGVLFLKFQRLFGHIMGDVEKRSGTGQANTDYLHRDVSCHRRGGLLFYP